ncbi:MAG: thioredoxin-disulfide reductase [Candidatus Thermoplasmatota archaeon]|nr:thioredoxin-disulfide reductase [Candidatus Thermoplasmatota archaeon]
MENSTRNLIIIGSGPAGLTAAIYASRALLKPLVIAGRTPGGQLMITSEVENFPGFPEAILGPDLMVKMREQASRFGSDFIDDDVTAVDFSTRPLKVMVDRETFTARAVIVATGASALWLGLESEKRFMGKGVSGCATCDGAFFKNAHVAVIGGGDSALEEALFLTRYASHVTIVHRRDRLRASPYMQKRAESNEKISFKWNSVVSKIVGEKTVRGLVLKNVKTGLEESMAVGGVFVAIGHKPNTDIFRGQLPLDDKGYIIVRDGSRTGVEGVFASGDVHDHRYRQAVTAAGMGCVSALDAQKYLEENDGHN